jgi:hypothetical protein
MALRPTVAATGLTALAVLLSPAALAAKESAGTGAISGKVVYRGHGLPRERPVRVEVSTRFPIMASAPDRSLVVDKKGGFDFPDLAAGTYWVVAYIDDDRDGHRGPGEICGFPRIAPIYVGPDHPHVKLTIDLDPVHAILATRFRVAGGKTRLDLAFAAVYARNPATGAPLPDATATVEFDGQAHPLTWDPAFPGGALVLYGEALPATDRYVFVVSHPALGKTRRRVVLHARSLGTEPLFVAPTPIEAPRGKQLEVGWHQPAWANFATLEVFEPDPLGGLRRRVPAEMAAAVTAQSPVVVPADLLAGQRLRLELIAGRADVRAENGEIWAYAVAGHEVKLGAPGSPVRTLGDQRGAPAARLKTASPQAKAPDAQAQRPPARPAAQPTVRPASAPAPGSGSRP